MVKQIEHEVAYYYDANPTEEDMVPESIQHGELVRYLILVLQWLLREQLATVCGNLGFYQTINSDEKPVAPDIAVIKGVAVRAVRSWKIGITGPAPQVVFEIASQETWDKDLAKKPAQYARMGAEEYFAYDPNEPPLKTGRRLYGWQRNTLTGRMRALPVGPGGRLWSPHLDSFLVPNGEYLQLYDRAGHLRLTEAQEEAQAKWAEARRADAEAEAKWAEARRADTEKQRADALAEKLRSLGIDPNEIV